MWIEETMYFLCFTTLTGTIMSLVWMLVARALERIGFLNITYRLLKLLLFFWLVPFVYGLLYFLNAAGIRWGGNLFAPSPTLLWTARIVLIIWASAAIVRLCSYIKEQFCVKKRLEAAEPCGEAWMRELFAEVCGELGLPPEKVSLYLSELEAVSIVAGVRHPRVVLPKKGYSRRELEIVLRHELTHVKHRDLLARNLAYLVTVFHAVNPMAYWYARRVGIWSEYACDEAVCRGLGTLNGYFNVLLKMARRESGPAGLTAGLFERKSEMRKRAEHVKRSYQAPKRSKLVVAVVSACLFVASTGSVCTATVFAADGAAAVAEKTRVEYEDTSGELIEYVEPIFEDADASVLYDDTDAQAILMSSGLVDVSWKISAKSIKIGSSFYAEKGDVVSVSMRVSPSNVKVKVGLVQPDHTYRYVIGSDTIVHGFEITQSGYYKFYAENMSETTAVTVEGNYQVF